MNLRLAVGLTTVLASPLCQAQPPFLNLYTFESPPYQMVGSDTGGESQISGETADTVICAANRAGWSTRIRITPQNRAIHSLERNMIDGYFAIDYFDSIRPKRKCRFACLLNGTLHLSQHFPPDSICM